MLKPFLTVDDQIARLKDFHGLEIEDDATAKLYLARRNYYRLNYYFKKFLGDDDKFGGRISFNDIVKIEETDSKLRHMFFQYIEYIELKLRTQFGYWTAEAFQADAFFTPGCFNGKSSTILNCILHINHTFRKDSAIRHHAEKYSGVLPTWVIVEFMTFGALSQLLNQLKGTIQNKILSNFRSVNNFQISKSDFKSWIHTVSVFRNTCAHHGALFRLELSVTPALWRIHKTRKRKTIDGVFAIVYCIFHLLSDDERKQFMKDLNKITKDIRNHRGELYSLKLKDYGFPTRWRTYLNVKRLCK